MATSMATRRALTKATGRLADADPVMAGLIERHGPCSLVSPRRDPAAAATYFSALAESVLYQQLAGSAAAAIHRKLVAAVGDVTPDAVLAAGDGALRGAGLSRAKASTILNLARVVVAGELDLEAVAGGDDDEVVRRLVELPGIGPWTAHMFCIFTLGRLDVWPVTDYGVRKGYSIAYGTPELPTPRALTGEGERFRPYRSVAAWYLWRAVETVTPGG